MTLNLTQLKELMSPLTKICKKEKEVDISGIKVTIKYLTPIEELEVQRMLPDLNEDPSALEFADVFRRETLARAIVQVNDLNLRDLSVVETGEVLPNGTAVKLSKVEAILKIMETWSKQLISKLFEHYGFLSEEIEKDMDESLKLNVEDSDVEKESLQNRITNLDRAKTLNDLNDEKEVP